MSPRKLTDDTKQEILKLYRQTDETTSTLAERYGVSSSTISRFLKSHLSESEYEDLIQQKRLGRTPKGAQQMTLESEPLDAPAVTSKIPDAPEKAPTLKIPVVGKKAPTPKLPGIEEKPLSKAPEYTQDEEEEEADSVDVVALGEMLGEDLADLEEDEEDLEDVDDEDWEDETDQEYSQSFPTTYTDIKVLPLSAASFPKTCYLVIDRAAELITRPLREFADLGKIPSEEIQQKTLPVFDNHRVARRFSNRFQRVIKVPDGRMLQKTCSYLQAKGITRLLMDGQIYSLSSF